MAVAASAPEGVLLDTDVVSFLLRGGDRAAPWVPVLNGRLFVLSFITVAELKYGALHRGWGASKTGVLDDFIAKTTVIASNEALVDEFAALLAEARAGGAPLAQPEHRHDAWIAATARLHGLPLATGNRRHFDACPRLVLLEPTDKSVDVPAAGPA